MITATVWNYLHRNQVRFVPLAHPLAFTAHEVAEAAHVPGKKFCKTVIVKADGRLVMAVLHADERIDLEGLRRALRADQIGLAPEREFEERFGDCETGAMPPFGNLYGMPVVVSDCVASQPQMIFNAGTHTDVVTMLFEEFERLVKPRIATFTVH